MTPPERSLVPTIRSLMEAPEPERTVYGQVVLERRLRDALAGLNPGLPAEVLSEAWAAA